MKKHESGYTLIGVLAIFTIASILAISLVTLSMNTLNASKTEVDNQSVFYIAEAGLNHAMNELEQEVKEIDEMSQNIDIEKEILKSRNKVTESTNNLMFEKVNDVNEAPSIELDIRDGKKENEYILYSTGIIGNQKRTIEQAFEINPILPNKQPDDKKGAGKWSPFKDYGVYSFGDMVLDGGSYNKDIGTANKDEGSITLKNKPTIYKDIKIPEDNKNIVQGNTTANITQEDPLERPRLPDFPSPDDSIWEEGPLCNNYFHLGNEKRYIKVSNIDTLPHDCKLGVQSAQPAAELNILIDPSMIHDKEILTIIGLTVETEATNRTPINLYVNGNINFPDGSNGGNVHANIYAKGDIIIKSGSAGINFYGSLFSKEGNIKLENGHSASEFYGELVYAENNITFGSPGIVMHGTSVIGDSVDLKNTTINTVADPYLFPDPHRIKSGSLSLKGLDNHLPDENDGSDGTGGSEEPIHGSSGGVEFKIKSPLHEVDNPK